MNLAQALGVAAAAWVTAVAASPSANGTLCEAKAHVADLTARLEQVADLRLNSIGGGFSATPDGVRMERATALR
ncbi:MAG: hypothetical protein KF779_03060 [Hyphomonadaceae bacterium]|nr:hypothetical protein [Hyphomonadaceae bacterium]